MFCVNCGFEFNDDFSFCPNCGAKAEKTVSKNERADITGVQTNKKSDTKKTRSKPDEPEWLSWFVEIGAETEDEEYDFENECSDALGLYEKARRAIFEQREPELAFLNMRQCLEVFLKRMCAGYSTDYDSRGANFIETAINLLAGKRILSEKDASLLHRIRIDCNAGVHPDDTQAAPGLASAKNTFNDLTDAVDVFRNAMSGANGDSLTRNVPMENPDYYDPKARRYYGSWERCYSRQELMSNAEYLSLLEKAKSRNVGDIEAMLDIASGFLPRKGINWQNDISMINFPAYQTREITYNTDFCFDTRYYYWVKRAVSLALSRFENNPSGFRKSVPLKYMATALLEMKKYEFFSSYQRKNYLVRNVQYVYDPDQRHNVSRPQYVDQDALSHEMFGERHGKTGVLQYTGMLRMLLSENDGKRIISPVHRENTMKYILFIDYCVMHVLNATSYNSLQNNFSVTPEQAISPEDVGRFVDADLLKKYCGDPVCQKYADIAIKYAILNRRKEEKEGVAGKLKCLFGKKR